MEKDHKQCWQWHSRKRWGAVAHARRGGALQELKEMQKVDVETSPVGKNVNEEHCLADGK